jgi:hypothetical protein
LKFSASISAIALFNAALFIFTGIIVRHLLVKETFHVFLSAASVPIPSLFGRFPPLLWLHPASD